MGIATTTCASNNVFIKEHDPETLRLGIAEYGRYDYYDKDYFNQFKSANVDLGPPKRPW